MELRQKTGTDDDLKFLANEINVKRLNTPRTIVFLNSINGTTDIHLNFRSMLNDGGRLRELPGRKYITQHFSSELGENTKHIISENFRAPEGPVRVLFSTIAYGCNSV